MKTTLVVDMHFGALLGVGWTSSDFGNVSNHVVTADVPAGATVIPVDGNFGLNEGILAAYKAANNEWYTFRIRSSSPTSITADRPLEAISANAPISNAYVNDAHPNVNGGAAVADYIIRQLADPVFGRKREVERVYRDTTSWAATGGATINYTPADSYSYPGGNVADVDRSANLSGSLAGGARAVSAYTPAGGDYILKTVVNTGDRAGGMNSVKIFIDEIQPNGSAVVIASKTVVGWSANYLIEIPFSSAGDKPVRPRIEVDGGAAWNFRAGQIEFHRIVGDPINLNSGKVVLFGDSWVTPGSAIATRIAARLTGAVVVPKGIGGNRTDQMIARFASDVVPEAPTIVINLAGTNDYYAPFTPGTYETNLKTLRAKEIEIGAQPVTVTASVGAATYSPPQMFPSRRFENFVQYLDFNSIPDLFSAPWRAMARYANKVKLLANSEVTVFRAPGVTKADAFLSFLECDNEDVSVHVGFSENPDGSGMTNCRDFQGGVVARKWWIRKKDIANRGYLCIVVRNDTPDDVEFTLSADIAWKGDLS
jgi:hypothetical protein